MKPTEDVPVVSVLMPVFNAGVHLEPAIRSILDQDFADFELVIVDDASTDGSDQVIASFDDPRIRVVSNAENLGVVGAPNRGLDLCRGRYIARMDADDVARPERLAVQVAFMDANPYVALCGSQVGILQESETDRRTTSWVVPGGTDLLRFSMMFANPFCHPTVMLRADVLRRHELRYSADYIYAEEYDLFRRISSVAGVVNLRQQLVDYRIHDDQMSEVHATRQAVSEARVKRDARRALLPWSPPFDERVAPLLFDAAWFREEPGWREVRRMLSAIPGFGGWRALLELACWAIGARVVLLVGPGPANPPFARFLTRLGAGAIVRSIRMIPERMQRRIRRAAPR